MKSTILLTLILSTTAAAQSIDDQRLIKKNQDAFDAAIKLVNEKCGTKLTASYALRSERPNATRPAGGGYGFCGEVLEGISWACKDDIGRQAVAKKVKDVRCTFAEGSSKKMSQATGSYRPELSVTRGTLSAAYDWNTANVNVEVRDWLLTHR